MSGIDLFLRVWEKYFIKKILFLFLENLRENSGSRLKCLQSLPVPEFPLESWIPGDLTSQNVVHGPIASAPHEILHGPNAESQALPGYTEFEFIFLFFNIFIGV